MYYVRERSLYKGRPPAQKSTGTAWDPVLLLEGTRVVPVYGSDGQHRSRTRGQATRTAEANGLLPRHATSSDDDAHKNEANDGQDLENREPEKVDKGKVSQAL